MKGLVVFSSLMAGFVISLTLASAQASTLPVMESHGSLKISSTGSSTSQLVSDQDKSKDKDAAQTESRDDLVKKGKHNKQEANDDQQNHDFDEKDHSKAKDKDQDKD